MDLRLRGKVTIVTGATANIGRAIAVDFAAEGAKLVAVGRDEQAGERLLAQALARGAEAAVFVRADIARREPEAGGCLVAGTIVQDQFAVAPSRWVAPTVASFPAQVGSLGTTCSERWHSVGRSVQSVSLRDACENLLGSVGHLQRFWIVGSVDCYPFQKLAQIVGDSCRQCRTWFWCE